MTGTGGEEVRVAAPYRRYLSLTVAELSNSPAAAVMSATAPRMITTPTHSRPKAKRSRTRLKIVPPQTAAPAYAST